MINTILQYVIEGALTAILGVITFIIQRYYKKKQEEGTATQFDQTIAQAVEDATSATYQTYVQAIKGTSAWNSESQKEALKKSLTSAKDTLSDEVLDYIDAKYGSVNKFLTEKIEATLYKLKNKNKNSES